MYLSFSCSCKKRCAVRCPTFLKNVSDQKLHLSVIALSTLGIWLLILTKLVEIMVFSKICNTLTFGIYKFDKF